MKTPIVYLVGAGPGDPGLITVKGLECIAKAEVLIYDYLASPSLLRHAAPGAERIYVGKKGGDHTLPQEEINALIVRKAREGRVVTRLKGGDPFVFGRGGEEAEVLVEAGIAFEVVPGVTSAVAAPAYAGIPLSHRRLTATIAFVTGHEDPTKESSAIDWPSLARGIGTLVFFMGVKNLPYIVRELTANGRPPETPVALVRWGTTPAQVTVSGTLADIAARVREAGLTAPAIIVVGEVVSLRERLNWFERRPLLGRRIIVTRSREQASDLVRALSDLGAECLEFPTIEVAPPDDISALDAALAEMDAYDWVVFTSVNGVSAFFERLFRRGRDVRALGHIQTAAIGPATAARLMEFGLTSDLVPETYVAESVVAAFGRHDLRGRRILLPRAQEARPVLPDALAAMGAVVREVPAYKTLQAAADIGQLVARLESRSVDLITFTSSSTVKNFMALLPAGRFAELAAGLPAACIGPVTADTARQSGFDVAAVAAVYTIPGLCAAVQAYFEQHRGRSV
ncbi:MAG: uroporphyrinogen-III C-methyltransferase [Desulfobacterales bacterium]|jgi:uroporphyrinogen III methyltransferase/synthase|nr:uroporphyrinogen-III C-methyltransferase [Desulfobacterales bacterium]